MEDHVITGRTPSAEGWTSQIPANLQKMKMSEYLKRGRSSVVTRHSLEEGSGYSIKPRQTKADREQQKTRESLRAQFSSRGINEASLQDKEFVESTEYDYKFEPRDSDMLTSLEYSSKSWLLRAVFKNNGATVVYGGVPANVFARLQYVEESGGSVGAAFWDLIRIYERRGLPVGGPYYPKSSNFVREGGKYAMTYTERGESLGPRPDEYETAYYDPMAPEGQESRRLTKSQREALEAARVAAAEKIEPNDRGLEGARIRRMPTERTRRDVMRSLRKGVEQLSPESLKAIQAAIERGGERTGTLTLSKEDLDLLK